MKPNCYQCKYRSRISGDAHSACRHPSMSDKDQLLTAIHFQLGDSPTAQRLNIRANSIGIERGWFFWPLNFDPIWLENCDGFVTL